MMVTLRRTAVAIGALTVCVCGAWLLAGVIVEIANTVGGH